MSRAASNVKYFDVSHAHTEAELRENERLLGMFVAWAIQRGLTSDFAESESPGITARVTGRENTNGFFFADICDLVCCGKLTSEDLNEQGAAFAKFYFRIGAASRSFNRDVQPIIAHLPEHADSWDVFDRFAAVLDKRFSSWQSPWWKFWG